MEILGDMALSLLGVSALSFISGAVFNWPGWDDVSAVLFTFGSLAGVLWMLSKIWS